MTTLNELDLKGLKCPLPVLKTRKAMRKLCAGEQLRIATTDPLAVIDIPAFFQTEGHKLIHVHALDDHHVFLVEKGS